MFYCFRSIFNIRMRTAAYSFGNKFSSFGKPILRNFTLLSFPAYYLIQKDSNNINCSVRN